MNLLIDASNIKSGGGFTHLFELLSNIDRKNLAFDEVAVVGGSQLDKLKNIDWITKIQPQKLLTGGFLNETKWKLLDMPKLEKKYDLIFAPGGTFTSVKTKYVTMSQNMLVFQKEERARYGLSAMKLRLDVLQYIQTRSFRNAAGIIFISEFARKDIQNIIGKTKGTDKIISHGISGRFIGQVKPQKDISTYSKEGPYKILYVSILDVYKHQDAIIRVVSKLNESGYPIHLDLVGGAYNPSLVNLQYLLEQHRDQVTYHGLQSYESIDSFYHNADAFVFASSCENMPNILIEAMAAALPIASSNLGPMPEFLQDAGFYFNPLDDTSVYNCLKEMIINASDRKVKAEKALRYSGQYNWKKCASETVDFLNQIAQKTN